MKKCPRCGKTFDDRKKFCGNCGRLLEDYNESAGVAEAAVNPEPAPLPVNRESVQEILNQGKEKVSSFTSAIGKSVGAAAQSFKNAYPQRNHECFVGLTEGEDVIREYQVSTVLFPPMRGYLMITNKRIVLYGSAFWSKIYQETPIDSVGSIDAFYGFRFHFVPLIIGLIFLLVFPRLSGLFYEIAYEFDAPVVTSIFRPMWIIGLIIVLLSVHRSIIITIKSTKANGAGIQYGSLMTRGMTSILFQGRAGRDADLMMSEIGAVVLDIQQKGTAIKED